jgi:hypothetical protein
VDRKKESSRRIERARLAKLSSIEDIISPVINSTNAQAMTQGATVESLGEILGRPERADGRI